MDTMTDESAAGRKTDVAGSRCERVATGLERFFENCQTVVGDCFHTANKHGIYREEDMRNIAAYLKIGAQLAGQIARLETVKNRGSIPQ
jgi:hypothetical protein